MKDDEGTIEVFIAMARMRVLRCCNLEGRLRVSGAEGTGGRRRLKGEKQYNMENVGCVFSLQRFFGSDIDMIKPTEAYPLI